MGESFKFQFNNISPIEPLSPTKNHSLNVVPPNCLHALVISYLKVLGFVWSVIPLIYYYGKGFILLLQDKINPSPLEQTILPRRWMVTHYVEFSFSQVSCMLQS